MPVYTNNLRLKEITTGDEDGTWGDSTNTNLDLIGEAFGYGTEQLAADANETFTMADYSSDGVRGFFLNITSAGSLTNTRTVTLGPNTINKLWIIKNSTTGGQSIIIKQGSGGTVTIANGSTAMVYGDGAGAGAAITKIQVLTDDDLGGTVQDQGDVLDDLNVLGASTADGEFLVATGAGTLAWESGATARTSLGVGTGDTPTFAGLTLSDDITFTNANPEIIGGDTNGVTYLSAGASTILGGSMRLYGDTHATQADDIEFYGSATLQLQYDDSGSLWDFQANAITTTGVITGNSFTGAGTGLTGTASSLTAGTVTTNANLTGEITSSGNAASLDVTAISNQTGVAAAAADYLLIEDATDGGLKKALVSSLPTGGSGDMVASTYDPASISEQLVGLTATQALTNKTLTTPTLQLKAGTGATGEGVVEWHATNNTILIGDGASTLTFTDDANLSITESQISDLQSYLTTVDLAADVGSTDLPYANLTPATAADKLLGRGSAAGAGDWQEITLGANLTMTGTTLAATSGGDAWGDVVDAVITPDADGTRDLATTTVRFATGYFDNLDVQTGGTITLAGTAMTATKWTYLANIGNEVSTAEWNYLAATTAFGGSLMDDADAAAARTTLGLGTFATAANINLAADVTGDLPFANIAQVEQNLILGRFTASTGDIEKLTAANVVDIIGTSIDTVGTVTTGTWEGTDVGVAHGGTGASTALGAMGNLVSGTSFTNVTAATGDLVLIQDVSDINNIKTVTAQSIADLAQAQGDVLDDLNTLGAATGDNQFLVSTGAGVNAWESGATAAGSLLDGASLTSATVAGTDKVLIQDTSASNALKTVTAQAIANLAGGATTEATGNVTLTSSSDAYQSIDPQGYGKIVTLPSATTMSEGRNVFTVSNRGHETLEFQDNGGNTLGFLQGRQTTDVHLIDNATANGEWAFSNTDGVGVNSYHPMSGASSWSGTADYRIKWVELEADKFLIVMGSPGAILHGVVYDAGTQTWGSLTTIRSVATREAFDVIPLTSSTALVISAVGLNATPAIEAVVLSGMTGTAITVNTAYGYTSSYDVDAELVANVFGSTYCIAFADLTDDVNVFNALTISGTVVTWGTEQTISGGCDNPVIYPDSNNDLIFIGKDDATIRIGFFGVSGTTLTAGTGTTLTSTAGRHWSTVKLSTNVALVYADSTPDTIGTIISVSGTTIQTSSVTLETASASTTHRYIVTPIGTDKVFVWTPFNTTGSGNVLTDNAGTAVAGTALDVDSTDEDAVLLGVTGTATYMATVKDGDSLDNTFHVMKWTESGGEPIFTSLGFLTAGANYGGSRLPSDGDTTKYGDWTCHYQETMGGGTRTPGYFLGDADFVPAPFYIDNDKIVMGFYGINVLEQNGDRVFSQGEGYARQNNWDSQYYFSVTKNIDSGETGITIGVIKVA